MLIAPPIFSPLGWSGPCSALDDLFDAKAVAEAELQSVPIRVPKRVPRRVPNCRPCGRGWFAEAVDEAVDEAGILPVDLLVAKLICRGG